MHAATIKSTDVEEFRNASENSIVSTLVPFLASLLLVFSKNKK